MSEKRDRERLRNNGNPLIIARAALDVDIKQTEQDMLDQLRSGATVSELFQGLTETPVVHLANTVLLDSGEALKDISYYSLKTLIATRPQQIFRNIVFGRYGSEEDRYALHTAGYTTYGMLLNDAINEKTKVQQNLSRRQQLSVYIGELTVWSLLNLHAPTKGGATVSSTKADVFHGVDGMYRYVDEESRLRHASLQVNMDANSTPKYRRKGWLGSNTIGINLAEVFGSTHKTYEVAKLVSLDSTGTQLPAQEAEFLADASNTLHQVVAKHVV